jgi:hypothetical protein
VAACAKDEPANVDVTEYQENIVGYWTTYKEVLDDGKIILPDTTSIRLCTYYGNYSGYNRIAYDIEYLHTENYEKNNYYTISFIYAYPYGIASKGNDVLYQLGSDVGSGGAAGGKFNFISNDTISISFPKLTWYMRRINKPDFHFPVN